MEFFGLVIFLLAFVAVAKLLNLVRATSPEERYLKTFGVPFNARSEETEKAFARVFIREKQPYATIYRQLLPFVGRSELTKEEKDQSAKLRKDMVKVLKHLKEILDLATFFKPKVAKKVAEELHIDQLIAILDSNEPLFSTASS